MTGSEADDEWLVSWVTRRFARDPLLNRPRIRHLGLAVSGGGDSMAMLWLVAPWANNNGVSVSVATVDHGLRPEAAEEARFVAGACERLGVHHETLCWTGWDCKGNLQAAAREARRALLASWASRRGVDVVLLAHTRDDEAETFLMRLARGSGVDGLAAMPDDWRERGQRWMRPLMAESRADLRDYLRRHGHSWVEDPSNEDEGFQRVRARKALATLEPLGIDARRVSRTRFLLSWASDALAFFASSEAARIATEEGGDVLFAYDELYKLPMETRLRLQAAAVQWVSSSPYRPRVGSLVQLFLASPRRTTLQGTLIRLRGRNRDTRLVIGREPRAASRAAPVQTTALWDGRWRLSGPHAPDLEVRMLGEAGLALCPDWRDTGLERSSLLASPAVWREAELVAAPVAGRPEGWAAEVVPGFHELLASGR